MSRFSSEMLEKALAFVGQTKAEEKPDKSVVQEPAEAKQKQEPPTVSKKPDNEALPLILALCRQFEGLYLKPYLCSANVPTIGYGATFYENGTKVTLRDPAITKERAEQLLRWHVSTYFLPAVLRLCPGADTPGRIAALCDFAFNVGLGNLRNSTLRKKVNAGEWDAVPEQFRRWNKAGGRVLRGLTRRREAEIQLL